MDTLNILQIVLWVGATIAGAAVGIGVFKGWIVKEVDSLKDSIRSLDNNGTAYGRISAKNLETTITKMLSDISIHQNEIEHMRATTDRIISKMEKIEDLLNKIYSAIWKNI